MRKPLIWLATLLLTLAGPAMASSYQGVPADAIFKSKQQRYGHLKYMGFYASAMQHWNFTRELAPFTNLTWVDTANQEKILARVREARDVGVGVVLSVQPLVFDAEYRLRDDYLYRLSTLQQALLSAGLMDQVTMVYPVDEPYRHASKRASTTRDQIREAIIRVNQELNTLFPGKPLGVIFSHGEVLRDDFQIPESYDWIGFDCYHSLFDCDNRPQTDHYRKLLKRMTPEQSLMAVPQAWVRYDDYEEKSGESEAQHAARKARMAKQLRKRLQHHYEIALSEPRVIAFIPFLWSMEAAPGQPEHAGFGLGDFAARFPEGGDEFQRLMQDIGTQIITGSHRYPNLSRRQTESDRLRPRNDYQLRIMDVSDNGTISAWGFNRALPHKSLRMQVAIYHEGEQVYLSKRRRSFILDDFGIPGGPRPHNPIGIHGFRHTVPRDVLNPLTGETVVVEVRIFGDRAKKENYRRAQVLQTW